MDLCIRRVRELLLGIVGRDRQTFYQPIPFAVVVESNVFRCNANVTSLVVGCADEEV